MTRNIAKIGFTIVELLVVIVVISILATITIISYSGIQKKAAIASLQSDLRNSSKILELDYVDDGIYPSTLGEANNGSGLRKSSGNSYIYSSTVSGYCISASSSLAGAAVYHISSSSGGLIEEGDCSKIWLQVAVGDGASCGIASDDKVYCWGNNSYGRLGDGTTTSRNSPTKVIDSGVLSGKTIISVAVSGLATCAVDSIGLVYCWGHGTYGELGNGLSTTSYLPVAVNMSGLLAKSLSAGSRHFCIISSTDNLGYCWGGNSYRQIGDQTTMNRAIPTQIYKDGNLIGLTFKKIVAGGSDHTCALASNKKMYCWGQNGTGQVGNNGTSIVTQPTAVYNASGALQSQNISDVVAGGSNTCALTESNTVACWGYGSFGQMGNNTTANTNSIPVNVDLTSVDGVVESLYMGSFHTCALTSTKHVYCWGGNDYGQVGDNTNVIKLVPTEIYTLGNLGGKYIKQLANSTSGHSSYTSCLITTDGKLYCWGQGTHGELGNGVSLNSYVPMLANTAP